MANLSLNEENPFVLPKDEEIFAHMEVERQRKAAEREANLNASVMDKTTFTTRMGTIKLDGSTGSKIPDTRATKQITAAAAAMPSDQVTA